MAAPEVTALVPLRGGGKTRLHPGLDADTRRELAGAMLADVCAALATAGVGRVVVVAGGSDAVAAARGRGVEVLRDPPDARGLNDALRTAAARVAPAGPLVVVAADLPRLVADDVARVLDVDAPVVLAPTDDGGTGALLRRPADVIATAYGPGSAHAHRRLAEAAGVACAEVDAPGLRTDVDTLGDLRALRTEAVGDATATVLRRLTSAARA